MQYITDNIRFLSESFSELAQTMNAYQKLSVPIVNSTVDEHCQKQLKAIANNDVDYILEEIPDAISEDLEGCGRSLQ